MRVTFLGTAAAEGIPSAFCNCDTCRIARIKMGKNARNRSAMLVNGDLCVDFGPDIHQSMLRANMSLSNLKYLLITHSHFDHFYPENLEIRSRRYLKEKVAELTVIGNPAVFYKLSLMGYPDNDLHICKMQPTIYQSIYLDSYEVIPIVANHAHEYGGALNYIICDGQKTILYATDTGIYSEEQFEKMSGYKFDLLVLDGTNLFSRTSRNHLNLEGVLYMLERMKKNRNIDNNSKMVLTHFSHEGVPMHEILQERLTEYNIIAAYDGMRIEV